MKCFCGLATYAPAFDATPQINHCKTSSAGKNNNQERQHNVSFDEEPLTCARDTKALIAECADCFIIMRARPPRIFKQSAFWCFLFSPPFWRAHVYHSQFRPADFLNSSEGASERAPVARAANSILCSYRGRFFVCARCVPPERDFPLKSPWLAAIIILYSARPLLLLLLLLRTRSLLLHLPQWIPWTKMRGRN